MKTETIIGILTALAQCPIKIDSRKTVQNAELINFTYTSKDGEGQGAAIAFQNDEETLFHLCDWEEAPIKADEIESHEWVTQDNRPTIMLEGLPRILFG